MSNSSAIGTLTNSGEIKGGRVFSSNASAALGGNGVFNSGTITALANSGAITGGRGSSTSGPAHGGAGVSNTGTIKTLVNTGTLTGGSASAKSNSGGAGVFNSGTIAALVNSGKIRGGDSVHDTRGAGVSNSFTIDTLTNNPGGTIIGGNGNVRGVAYGAAGAGVSNSGTIGTLSNSGKISGGSETVRLGTVTGGAGVSNSGTIGMLTNSGKIEGGVATSRSGKATPGDAIFSKGKHASIGTIANSGSIIGSVEIDSQGKVTVIGGSGSTFDSWTGGTITIGNGDLVFGGGNTFLGDDIEVKGGAGTVKNMDPLQIAAPQTIDGNFDQSASGTLDLEFAGVHPSDYGSLTMSGGAALDGALNADLIDGFMFKKGETFDILNFASGSGDFGSFSIDGDACSSKVTDIWTCGSGPVVEELFHQRSLDLYILRGTQGVHGVPEPSTWAMMAIGFLGHGGLSLRRRAYRIWRSRNITAPQQGA